MKFKSAHLARVALIAATAFSVTAVHAQNMSMPPAGKTMSGAVEMTHGEIKKVDAKNRMLVIKHGPLLNLGMPGMTMGFNVAEPAMLKQFRSGDKVDFVAEMVDGVATITRIEPVK